MNGEEARQVIRKLDERLRERDPVLSLLRKMGEQSYTLANTLSRTLYGPSKVDGVRELPPQNWEATTLPHYHPPGRMSTCQLENAHDWIINAWNLTRRFTKDGFQLRDFHRHTGERVQSALYVINSARIAVSRHRGETGGPYQRQIQHRFTNECVFCATWKHLDAIGHSSQIANEPPSFVAVPDEIHPPRHGYVNPGVLSRLVAADIADHIATARKAIAKLSDDSQPWDVVPWIQEVTKSLELGVADDVGRRFLILTRDAAVVDALVPVEAEPIRAYYTLCIDYLTEVQKRMPDYAEAAGQGRAESTHSINIHGGTFYGGQFASQIANIDSSISTVINQNPQLGDALSAIGQAVLDEPDLDEESRSDLLESVEYLADAAATPPERRSRGMVKAALAAIAAAATTGGQLQQAIESWGSILNGML